MPIKPFATALTILCLVTVTCPAQATAPATQPGQRSEQNTGNRLSATQAVILGVVEGLTEYLPVSSTGHLILAQRAMGMGTDQSNEKDAADAYAVCIQVGAILAVVVLYRRRIWQMIRGIFGQDPAGRMLAINIIIAFLPAVVIGLAFNKLIKSFLFGLWPVVIAWAVGGLAILLVADKRKQTTESDAAESTPTGRPLEQLAWHQALMIGIAQCIAMWPGTSRSLVTILGGLLLGLNLVAAVEFSFLLGLVTLSAATAYDGLKHGQLMLELYGAPMMLLGIACAFVSAVLAVRWMVSYLNRHSMAVFGYYRIALAVATATLLIAGLLTS